MKRRIISLALGIGLSCAGIGAGDVKIVGEGEPAATVVIGQAASAQVQAAAGSLVQYVFEASGARLPIVRDDALPEDRTSALIHVGTNRLPVTQNLLPAEWDADGFVMLAKGQDLVIAGPSDDGTEFGVYDFLERYVGVRWLLPGDDGTDVPCRKTIVVPEGRIQDQPVFFSRLLSGLKGAAQTRWARCNRMHGRVSFHHNLLHLFPPSRYAKSHPEFFPVLKDQARYLPTRDDDNGWQPCFTAPGIVEEAIRNISQYFRDHPQVTSYSLGMNDSGKFCRCADCLARISGDENYLGWVDYSDLYYDWCHRVITGVLKEHPDKWFGCLAYFNVAAPPAKATVHPRLVPYITYDRMKWIDADLRAAGEAATRQWQQSVPSFAWYDYIYGTPYCLPRVYFHHAGDYLRFAADHGVKAHYAEIYPNFGEGPKPYVHLRLWWNPRQDVDQLLAEWYERCVGPDAAPFLAKYYGLWERFWTRDIQQSAWFNKPGTWLAFSSPGYLADVRTADVTESRRLLEACIERCQTDRQRARARLLEKAFQYYEASALAYLAHAKVQRLPADTEADALAVLDSAASGLEMAQRRRQLALDVFPKDPVLINPLGIDRFPALSGLTWGGGGLWTVADWVVKGDNRVRQRVQELAADGKTELVRQQAAVLLAWADGETQRVSGNPSFEEGRDGQAAGWSYWRKPDVPPEKPVGRMVRSREVAHSGDYSLLCDAMLRGGPVQTLAAAQPGRYVAIAWIHAPAGQTSPGTVELSVTPLDEQGRNLPGFSSGRIQPPSGRWTLVTLGLEIPEKIEASRVVRVRLVPIVDGFQEGGQVFLDDVGLHRIE
ncbi:MAG: DUF4838 domain-containing protein [Candidatus Anammoximicrobium sp.]|nr:DUF4838 domain-containing protein [Candidatus Anammoximicrobium sp.]